MQLSKSTPFKRLLLSLPVIALVDILLVVISICKGKPTLRQLLTVNLWIGLILALRFGLSLIWRLRCPTCGRTVGKDTGDVSSGYPKVKCPKCGAEWLL
jgi:DNA-directed RNA polymerase subunit RPC12/RpoP